MDTGTLAAARGRMPPERRPRTAEVAEYTLMLRRTARPVAEYQAVTATSS